MHFLKLIFMLENISPLENQCLVCFAQRMKTKIKESCFCSACELCIMQKELRKCVGGNTELLLH